MISKPIVQTALIMAATVLFPAVAQAQQIIRYTEASGPNALGYPVPTPVASLQPVDGFRDYESLLARHQQLAAEHAFVSAHRVGTSRAGRAIWAYRLRNGGDFLPGGEQRGAMIINGAIHAREWQSPEVVTGLFETLVEREGEDPLVNWLLENIDIWILPIQNPDGFLQTQRYPDQAVVGQDPTAPGFWPRDGRMRRKNMRNADEALQTFGDHLQGVDLNRNNPPHWADGEARGDSSSDPVNLIYHGPQAGSEPETQALLALAELAGGVDDIRFYVDAHSFSQLFFMPLTHNASRNTQSRLIGQGMQRTLAATGSSYSLAPSSAFAPIGSTDELFAWQFQAPAYTLELEPGASGASQYGGFGVSHDGFVLPENQIARVREHHVDSLLWAFYRQAGPPWLAEVSLHDGAGLLVYHGEWQHDVATARSLAIEQAGLLAGREYQLSLRFSKPMRVRNQQGEPVALPSGDGLSAPNITLLDNAGAPAVAINDGEWRASFDDGPLDTYQASFVLPATAAGLQVDMRDLSQLRLDTDPGQPARWQDGRWIGYFDDAGEQTAAGGPDRNHAIEPVVASEMLLEPGIWWDSHHNGEGVELLLARDGDERILALLWYHFDPQGEPRWWLADATSLAADGETQFVEYKADGSSEPVGSVQLSFASSRSLLMEVSLDEEQTSIVRQLQRFDIGEPATGEPLTGAWFDPQESGWGLTLSDGSDARAGVLYYYDDQGLARWALAVGDAEDEALAPQHFTGACLLCEPAAPQIWGDQGSLRVAPQGEQLDVDVDVSYPQGGNWLRDGVTLHRLTTQNGG